MLDYSTEELNSRKAQILRADLKVKDSHYHQKFDQLIDKHGMQKDKISQHDKSELAKRFVGKGKEIAKKDLDIRVEIKNKKLLKEKELTKLSEMKSEFDNLSRNQYSNKSTVNMDNLFSLLNSETSVSTKNKQQKH